MASRETQTSLLEQLALAPDRQAVLDRELAPNTIEYFLWNITQHQVAGNHAAADEWIARLAQSRFTLPSSVELRQMFLRLNRSIDESSLRSLVDRLTSALGLRFEHQRDPAHRSSQQQPSQEQQQLPSRMDVAAEDALLEHFFQVSASSNSLRALVSSFPAVLEWIAAHKQQELKSRPSLLHAFMHALRFPSAPNLPDLVAAHLSKNRNSFGSAPVHRMLTMEQLCMLESLADTPLQSNEEFVKCKLQRLAPDRPLEHLSDSERMQYFQRTWEFARTLPPSFNSMRLAIMFNRLEYERSRGHYDHMRFVDYLGVPRAASYYHQSRRRSEAGHLAQFNSGVGTRWLHAVSPTSDADLVWDYLIQYFADPRHNSMNSAPLNSLLEQNYLQRAFATAKILYGSGSTSGDVDNWVQVLDAATVQRLKERVDLEFCASNPKNYTVTDPVNLTLWVKNVPRVDVKVFEINTLGYYRANPQQVPGDINLDGLSPHYEFALDTQHASPFYRFSRTIPLDLLAGRRGVFIVEAIGRGQKCRAVVRKGGLRFVEQQSIAGHVFRLYDEDFRQLRASEASMIVEGRPYSLDEHGEIVLPFGSSAKRVPVLLCAPSSVQTQQPQQHQEKEEQQEQQQQEQKAHDFATLAHFDRAKEEYSLYVSFYINRERLLSSDVRNSAAIPQAEVVLQPHFTLNGYVAALSLLKDLELSIETIDCHDVSAATTVRDVQLSATAETVVPFPVPEDLRAVRVALTCHVMQVSSGEKQQFALGREFEVNRAENTSNVSDLFLRYGNEGWVAHLLGRAAEPIPHSTLLVELQHPFISSPREAAPNGALSPLVHRLATDSKGRVWLGKLPGIQSVTVTAVDHGGIHRTWRLDGAGTGPDGVASPLPWVLHGSRGRSIMIPCTDTLLGTAALAQQGSTGAMSFAALGHRFRSLLRRSRSSDAPMSPELKDEPGSQPRDADAHVAQRVASLYRLCAMESDSVYSTDESGRLQIRGGLMVLPSDLSAGEYVLLFKRTAQAVRVRIEEGAVVGGYVMSPVRALELDPRCLAPLIIDSLQLVGNNSDGPALEMTLQNASRNARIHIFAAHFVTDSTWPEQGVPPVREPRCLTLSAPPRSEYLGGGALSDEHRYILQRRSAKRYAGNMLERPSLLLQPKVRRETHMSEMGPLFEGAALQETSPDVRDARLADDVYELAERTSNGRGAVPSGLLRSRAIGGPTSELQRAQVPLPCSMSFLARPSCVACNLRPDAQGRLRVPLSDLHLDPRVHTYLSVLAVDRQQTFMRSLALAGIADADLNGDGSGDSDSGDMEEKTPSSASNSVLWSTAYKNVRLMPCMDIHKHVTEQNFVSALSPVPVGNDQFRSLHLEDPRTATVVVYDTISDLYTLFFTMATDNPEALSFLSRFSFLKNWGELDMPAKLKLFNEHLSHELNFFLWHRDHAFFLSVALPHLYNKMPQCLSFLDRWFLSDGGRTFDVDALRSFMLPRHFASLNALEQILCCEAACRLLYRTAEPLRLLCLDHIKAMRPDPEGFLRRFRTALRSKMPSEAPKDEEEKPPSKPPRSQAMAPPPPAAGFAAPSSAMMMMPGMPTGGAFGSAAASMKKMKMKEKSVDRRMAREEKQVMASMPAEDEEAGEMGGAASDESDLLLDEDDLESTLARREAQRAQVQQLFRAPPTTKEYSETQYLSTERGSDSSQFVQFNRFWCSWGLYRATLLDQELRQSSSGSSSEGGGGGSGFFISEHVIEAASSFPEMVAAIAVTQLPTEGERKQQAEQYASTHGQPPSYYAGRDVRPTLGFPLLVFHKQLKESPVYASSVGVTQAYYDPKDPFIETQDGRTDKYLSPEGGDQFLVGREYHCRVVLTNASSTSQKLLVLLQIPEGAVPLGGTRGQEDVFFTQSKLVELGSYATVMKEYAFYFPYTGDFQHYPVHVSKGIHVIGHGRPQNLRVVHTITTPPDLTSWRYVSQGGTTQDVLQYLRSSNNSLRKLLSPQERSASSCSLIDMAWRFRPFTVDTLAFFLDVLQCLRQRMLMVPEVWSYALYFLRNMAVHSLSQQHLKALLEATSEYLSATQTQWAGLLNLGAGVGSLSFFFCPPFVKHDPLFSDDGTLQRGLRYLEYAPLLNPRAHEMKPRGRTHGSAGGKAEDVVILNDEFRQQYRDFLQYLLDRYPSIDKYPSSLLLCFCYYMLLQDRIEDAASLYRRMSRAITAEERENQLFALQRDYVAAYLDFYGVFALHEAAEEERKSIGVGDAAAVVAVAGAAGAAGAVGPVGGSPVELPLGAHQLVKKWLEYPVLRKRRVWEAMAEQLAEIEAGIGIAAPQQGHKRPEGGDEDETPTREQRMEQQVSLEPSVDFRVVAPGEEDPSKGEQSGSIIITHANLTSVALNFFLMDIELLFSTSPFIASANSGAARAGGDRFTFVRPNLGMTVQLSPAAQGASGRTMVPLPASLRNSNVFVEVLAANGSLSCSQPFYSHSLLLHVYENQGQIKIAQRASSRALSRTYVKVYARMNSGEVEFWKDGYTDLRGKFDYVSLSTTKLSSVEKFAILVFSDLYGAVVREAKPPSH